MSKLTSTIAALGIVAGLGVAALPLSSYAADVTVTDPTAVTSTDGTAVDQNVGINLTVDKTLSIDASADNVNLNKTNSFTGTPLTVKVTTNNAKGYKLNIKGTGTGTGANGKTALTGDDAKTTEIPTFEKSIAGGALAALAANSGADASKSVWGYTASGDNVVNAFTGGLYAGVTETGETIAENDAPTADTGNETSVTFKAIVDNAQPAGTYKGQVTFTASDITN